MNQRSEFELDERAANAVALLNNALLQEVLESIRESSINEMIAGEPGSKETFEAHAMVRAIDMLKANIKNVITDQKMAKKTGVVYGRS